METYEVLPIGSLLIDPLYQRRISKNGQKRIDKMATSWDDNLVGVLRVNRRKDGKFAVMDGQHRVLAAAKAGRTDLPCLINDDLSTFQEAKTFVELNTLPVRPRANDLFRARLVSGDPTALAVTTTLTKLGLTLSLDHNHGLKQLQSVGILEAIIQATGPEGLEDALRITMEAFPEDDKRWHSYIIGGVAGFAAVYAKHPMYTRKRFVDALKQHSVTGILQRINAYGMASIGTGAATTGQLGRITRPSSRQALLDVYNHRLNEDRRLPAADTSVLRIVSGGGNPWTPKK